jgi:hypothetical protein
MTVLTVVKGDYGYYLNFTVQDSAAVAYNLSGYTVKFKVWAPSTPGTLVLNGTCAVVVAANGTCRYLVTNKDFLYRRTYVGELELTKTGVVESTKHFIIEVKESG